MAERVAGSRSLSSLFSRTLEKDHVYIGVLISLFCVAFAIPVIFLLQFLDGSPSFELEERIPADTLFPGTFPVHLSGTFLRVKDSGDLVPVQGEDFLFLTWFKLDSFPKSGHEVIFVAKVDASDRSRKGYSIGLVREKQTIRPVITWRDAQGQGFYQLFSEMTIFPGTWTMLAMSYVDDRFLGIHVGRRLEEGGVQVESLGGYEMEAGIPRSSSDLVLGAQKSGRFRGVLGAFGIFSDPTIGDQLEETLRSFLREPQELPSSLPQSAVKFWTVDAQEDLGEGQYAIKRIVPKEVPLTSKRIKQRNREKKQ